MEQLIIILIFAAIAVANQLLKKSREGDNATSDDFEKIVRPPRPNRPLTPRPQETDEERMRRFMEALGVPPTSPPPRQVARPAQVSQPVETLRPPVRPARVTKSALPPLPSRKPVQPAPPPIVLPVLVEAGQTRPEPETSFPEAAPLVTAAAVGETPVDSPATRNTEVIASNLPENIRAMLRNRDSIRSAILLREIIDLPRGLRSYD